MLELQLVVMLQRMLNKTNLCTLIEYANEADSALAGIGSRETHHSGTMLRKNTAGELVITTHAKKPKQGVEEDKCDNHKRKVWNKEVRERYIKALSEPLELLSANKKKRPNGIHGLKCKAGWNKIQSEIKEGS